MKWPRSYSQKVKMVIGRMPALLVIDKDGRIRYSHYGESISDISSNRKSFHILDELNKGNFCKVLGIDPGLLSNQACDPMCDYLFNFPGLSPCSQASNCCLFSRLNFSTIILP